MSTPKEIQKEIISVSVKIVNALIALTIIYVYAGASQIERVKSVETLKALSIINALIIIANEPSESKGLSFSDIPKYHKPAHFSVVSNGFILPDQFTNELIEDGSLGRIPMRLSLTAICDISILKAQKGASFTTFSSYIKGGIYQIQSEDAKLISFGSCLRGDYLYFHALLLKDIKGETVVALPQSFQDSFPGLIPPKPLELENFEDIDVLIKQLHPFVQDYIQLEEPFFIIHEQALKHLILNYATTKKGKFYNADELDLAVSDIFKEVEIKASFLGINTTLKTIILYGPLAFLILTWELWRHTRRINPNLIPESSWFPFDVSTRLTAIIATVFSFAPLLMGLLIIYLFAETQGLAFSIFGKYITFRDLMTLNFTNLKADISGTSYWGKVDVLATLIGFATLALLILLFQITLKLLQIIKASSRRNPFK